MVNIKRTHTLVGITLLVYLLSLLLFTFFPRPVLESGDSASIAEFLRTHSNFFYKILYADANQVAFGNFFMLTPLPILLHAFSKRFSGFQVVLAGVCLSIFIEGAQLLIPGRVSDFRDLLANSISILIGQACVSIAVGAKSRIDSSKAENHQ